MILYIVVTEAETSLGLVKSDLCIIFSEIIMKSATQQCKNERTSFFRDGVDLLCYRDNINDLEGCILDRTNTI